MHVLQYKMGNSGCCNRKPSKKYDYDLIVIGGGQSGITAAREAARLELRVVLIDYSFPNKFGYSWGLGGQATNANNIPKRFLQNAINIRRAVKQTENYGWEGFPQNNDKDEVVFNWTNFIEDMQKDIEELSRSAVKFLDDEKIVYINGMGEFVNRHTVKVTSDLDPKAVEESGDDHDPPKNVQILTAWKIIIAVGTEPLYLDIPGGRESDGFCVTSDELMFQRQPPEKSVVIGNEFLAVELAGMLHDLGFDTTLLMTTNKFLPDIDHDISYRVRESFKRREIPLRLGFRPKAITEIQTKGNESDCLTRLQLAARGEGSKFVYEIYDTIILACGRKGFTDCLNLEMAGIKVREEDKKILINRQDRTSAHSIFAIGGCAYRHSREGPPIDHWNVPNDAGKWLVQRLFTDFRTKPNHDKKLIYVMSPMEFASIGVTEQEAFEEYENKKIKIFEKAKIPIQSVLDDKPGEFAYAKLVCIKNGLPRRYRKGPTVLGIHYFGPYAAEIIQGFAIALTNNSRRLYYKDFAKNTGVALTSGELFYSSALVQRTGEDTEYEENMNFQVD